VEFFSYRGALAPGKLNVASPLLDVVYDFVVEKILI
jgi:hypothetical protein